MQKPRPASLGAAALAAALAVWPAAAGATQPSDPPCMVQDPERYERDGRSSPTVAAFERSGWTPKDCSSLCRWQFVSFECSMIPPKAFVVADVNLRVDVLFPADNPQSAEIARRWAAFPSLWEELLRDPRVVLFVRLAGLGSAEIRSADGFRLDREDPDRGPWFWVRLGSLRWREEFGEGAERNRGRYNSLELRVAPGRIQVTGLAFQLPELIRRLDQFLPKGNAAALSCARGKRSVELLDIWRGEPKKLRAFREGGWEESALECEAPVTLDPPIKPDRALIFP